RGQGARRLRRRGGGDFGAATQAHRPRARSFPGAAAGFGTARPALRCHDGGAGTLAAPSARCLARRLNIEYQIRRKPMKAILLTGNGGPEMLRYGDAPDPVAGPGEVLVDIHAASINAADYKVRLGASVYSKIQFPHILGSDF